MYKVVDSKQGERVTEKDTRIPSEVYGGYSLEAESFRPRAELEVITKAVDRLSGGLTRVGHVLEFVESFISEKRNEEFAREDVLAVLGNLSLRGGLEQFNYLRTALGPKVKVYTPRDGGVADAFVYLANNKEAFRNLTSFRNIGHNGSVEAVRDEAAVDGRTVVLLDDFLLRKLESDDQLRQQLVDGGARFVLPGASLKISPISGISLDDLRQDLAEVLEYSFVFDVQLSSGSMVNEVVDRVLNSQLDLRLKDLNIQKSNLNLFYWSPKSASEYDIVEYVNKGGNFNSQTYHQTLENSSEFNERKLDVADRALLAAYIAETVQVYSVGNLCSLLKTQREAIENRVKDLEVDDRKIFYVVPNALKSYGIIAGMYKQANPQLAGEFVSIEQFKSFNPDAVSGSVVVVLDDLCASGNSLDKVRGVIRQTFKGPLILAPCLASTEAFSGGALRNFPGFESRMSKDPLLFIESAKIIRALSETAFYQSLSVEDSRRLEGILGDLGYGNQATLVFFPYMTPNNNTISLSKVLGPNFTLNGQGISVDY